MQCLVTMLCGGIIRGVDICRSAQFLAEIHCHVPLSRKSVPGKDKEFRRSIKNYQDSVFHNQFSSNPTVPQTLMTPPPPYEYADKIQYIKYVLWIKREKPLFYPLKTDLYMLQHASNNTVLQHSFINYLDHNKTT